MPFITLAIQRKTGTNEMDYLLKGIGGLHMLTSIPSLFILTAWIKRSRKSGSLVRWIWARAAWFLIAGAILDITLLSSMTKDWLKGFATAQLLLDVYVLIYVCWSRKVRDVFSDFPQPSGK